MAIDELVKIEREFLKEMEAERNEHGVYAFVSENGKEYLSLDFYLREYKEWLIEKKIIKVI